MNNEFVVIKASESSVKVIGITRGNDSKAHHTEILDKGEVLIVQFTDKTSAIKIKGKAIISTAFGETTSGLE